MTPCNVEPLHKFRMETVGPENLHLIHFDAGGDGSLAEPLKILYVLRPTSGGMRSHSLGLLKSLDPKRFRPMVICPPGNQGIQSDLKSDIPVFTLDIHGEINPSTDLRNALKIARIAKEYQVDIIHAHGYKTALLCLGSALRRTGNRLVCTFHNPFRKGRNAPKAIIQTSLGGWISRQYDCILTVSNALRDEAVTEWGLTKEKIRCIYNGIDLAPFEQRKSRVLRIELGIKDDAVLIGTTARLIPQKGISYLMLAAESMAAEFPNIQFVVAGDGPDLQRLQNEINEKCLSRVFKLLGFRTDIPELLSAIDIFALPTLEEGFSISALEAMASGKPIVASRVGGIPEVISEDVGLLVPPGQVEPLCRALRLLIGDEAVRTSMGLAGRMRVKSNFTLQRMVKEHEQIYESLTMGELIKDSV